MPTYDYDCTECQRIEEKTVTSFNQEVTCDKCGKQMHRMFSPPGFSSSEPVSGPKRHELWQAYKDHKIRFRVDAVGNDMIEIVGTGEKIRSHTMTSGKLREAYDPPPPRDASGALVYRDHTGRRIWPEQSKQFFMSG